MLLTRNTVASPVPPSEATQRNTQDYSQDANFALMELEKGLRSNQCGEQCEAIVHVPSLLDKHPFPLLVNSAFLKLADVFRTGSNFMKLCVLKAIQSSKRHLVKIFNADEFCRRFFVVIHSNDPIARAVTLRVFGNIASIASQRKNIHHCIRNSLDSHDSVEREAAIFALKCYAEQSSSFAESIWMKVADTIQNLLTPVEVKLKLLPVFQYMHHDYEISTQVYGLCEKLLESYPAHCFVVTILNTTTQLTISTLLHVPKQVDLLLHYLTNDPRKAINLCAVKNLHLLATKMSHLWKKEQVEQICASVSMCLQENVKEKILSLINTLSKTANAMNLFTERALDLLEDLTSNLSITVASIALQARINIATQGDVNEELIQSIESDVQMVLALSLSEENTQAYERCLSFLPKLLSTYSASNDLASTRSFLLECFVSLNAKHLIDLCHMLTTSNKHDCANIFQDDIDTLLGVLKDHLMNDERSTELQGSLITLIMQISFHDVKKKLKVQDDLIDAIIQSPLKYEYWCIYKIARKASHLSFPKLSARLFEEVYSKVSSEHYLFWLGANSKFQQGETVLTSSINSSSVDQVQELLSIARDLYQDGLTNLKAAVTTSHPLYFQFKFARLRADMLKAYGQLLTCCSMVKLCPPPQMVQLGQNVQYSSRIAGQFQNCANLFVNITNGYHQLYKASFNADPATLKLVQLLQESSQLMTNVIEELVLYRYGESHNTFTSDTQYEENTYMGRYHKKLSSTNIKLFQYVKSLDGDTKDQVLSQRHIDCITSMVLSHINIGFSYPLYFFSTHQNTSVQLSIAPSNSLKEHPYMVNINHNMTIQVEGVIKQKYSNVPFRSIGKVNLRVKIIPDENVKNPSNVFKPVVPTETIIYESTEPHNDYFDAPFLLSFKYIGKHVIKISTGVTDQNGVDWETGPSYVLYADVIEQHAHARRK